MALSLAPKGSNRNLQAGPKPSRLLPRKLEESAAGMDQVGDLASHKLGEALSMALSGSESITNSVRRVREQMDRVMAETEEHIARLSGSADAKVTDLLENLGREAARISGVLGGTGRASVRYRYHD
jgi:hypothetical protein